MSRNGIYSLSSELRSALRYQFDTIVEGPSPAGTYSPNVGGSFVYSEIPSFPAASDTNVMMLFPAPKYLAHRDVSQAVVVDLRMDFFWEGSADDDGLNYLLNLKMYEAGPGVDITGVSPTLDQDYLFAAPGTGNAGKIYNTRGIANASHEFLVNAANLTVDSTWVFVLTRKGTDLTDDATGDFRMYDVELWLKNPNS